ncbi:hypothetical protein LBMAG42_57600 [Deltaproteobacteria bacterium]|nr:hypothetical protein LBMAG42_57600 [Deltaproteobacteria bacterium]
MPIPTAWTVPDVLSAGDASALIEHIEALGPEAAPITTSRGFEMRPDIRNNTRVIFDDPGLAAALFERVRRSIQGSVPGWTPVGLNERFRCYRYRPGEYFAPHYDGAFHRSAEERSLITVMVYLNADFTGGETNFPDIDVAIKPVTGSAPLFWHRQLHEGAAVRSGTKYILRSDVMYRRST